MFFNNERGCCSSMAQYEIRYSLPVLELRIQILPIEPKGNSNADLSSSRVKQTRSQVSKRTASKREYQRIDTLE